jgi:hypothetical protein
MILKTAKERCKSRTRRPEFKCFHWWDAMKHQPKGRAKFVGSSSTDPWVSSSDRTTEEKVSHSMDRDRAKAATLKGERKWKEGSSSQCESSSIMGGMMFTLKMLNTLFAKAQLWKQWNKLKDSSTMNMDEE